jgi:hypothetical protein
MDTEYVFAALGFKYCRELMKNRLRLYEDKGGPRIASNEKADAEELSIIRYVNSQEE